MVGHLKAFKPRLAEAIRLARKRIYPLLDLRRAKNAHFSPGELLDVLTHAAMGHDFTHNGANTLRLRREAPTSQNVLHHIGKLEKGAILAMFGAASEAVLRMAASRGAFQRPLDLAIDLTDWRFYGDHRHTPMVLGTKPDRGTQWAYKFATATMVVAGVRFCVAAVPVGPFDSPAKVLEALVQIAQRFISIRTLYVDRGFFGVESISVLERVGVRWLMPATQGERVRRVVEASPMGTVVGFSIRATGAKRGLLHHEARFRLAVVESTKKPGTKVAFATNLEINGGNAQAACDRYGRRWGIETSFRVQDGFIAKTTSKNYAVRLFYFLFSVCLYNLWVLANIVAGAFLWFLPRKPVVTAKMFGVMLYATLKFDGGG